MAQRAFTLLELLIVAVVLGVLAVLAYPRYIKTVDCRHQREARDTTDELLKAEQIYRMRHGHWTEDINELPLLNPNRPGSQITYTIEIMSGARGEGSAGEVDDDARDSIYVYADHTKGYRTFRCVDETEVEYELAELRWPCPHASSGGMCSAAGSSEGGRR